MQKLKKQLPVVKVIPGISISVKDDSEQGLSGVTVTFNSDSLDEPIVKTTGSAGGCKFTDINEGTYTVTAELEGYDDYSNEVSFTIEETSLDIVLTETQ